MFRIHLPFEDSYLLLAPRFDALTPGWQGIVLGLLLLVPLGLVIWLYRYELKLIHSAAASFLLLSRIVLLLLLWFVAALQPIVARDHAEDLPSRVLVAIDVSASMEVRDFQRPLQEKLALAKALRLEAGSQVKVSEQVDGLTRLDIVNRILTTGGLDWIARLAKKHHVDLVGFDGTLSEARWPEDLLSNRAKGYQGMATDLRLPLARALEAAAAGQGTLLGVVLFTDGRHNAGPSPLAKAKELGAHKIPIYPVLVGAKDPPADIAVLEVKAPTNVFKDADIHIASRIKINAVPAGDILVELTRNGKGTDQAQTIHHDGKDQVVPVQFHLRMDEIGSQALEVKAHARDLREVTLENNAQTTSVRVARDKARVLLIDGEMRWEYHYLASALLRDPTMSIDQVVFSQPRTGDLSEEKLAALGHPRVALPTTKAGADDPLNVYDCILLGDVPPAHLPLEARRRLERYVDERGGTLVLLAGKSFFPSEYLGSSTAGADPLLKMLPITNPQLWHGTDGFRIALTSEGKHTPFMQLEPTSEATEKRFTEFPKHFWGLLGKAKPGATTLATPAPVAADAADQPGLIVQQNYGFGRVLMVGVDSTWRWRYRIGDVYHHRFWGQVVRWAAADKLLPGGNRFVRFGSREPVIRAGRNADIMVRLGEETPFLRAGAVMQVRLWRQLTEGKEEQAALVSLTPSAKLGKLLEAQVGDLPPGQYRVEVDIPELRDQLVSAAAPEDQPRRDWFTVALPDRGEMFDLSTDENLLRALAEESKGRLFTADNVESLLDLFARQVIKKESREELRVWRDAPLVWWTFGLLIALLTVEWIGRKWAGLP